jgi:hypothetical protein
MNRWCILAGPRSGSTFLENSIWAGIKKINPNVPDHPLGEFIHPEISRVRFYSMSTDGQIIFIDSKYPLSGEIPREERTKFVKNRLSLVSSVSPTSPMAMRVFCQPQELKKEDYLMFLEGIRNVGFDFIALHRNLFDRAISWYFMQETGIVIRYMKSPERPDELTEVRVDPRSQTPFDPHLITDPIVVDTDMFADLCNMARVEDLLLAELCGKFDCKHVRYETMLEDCAEQGIFAIPSNFVRAYDRPYREMVSNYPQLIEIAKNHDISRKGASNG